MVKLLVPEDRKAGARSKVTEKLPQTTVRSGLAWESSSHPLLSTTRVGRPRRLRSIASTADPEAPVR